MKCPRCQEPIPGEECAHCGYRLSASPKTFASPGKDARKARQSSIEFEASVQTQEDELRPSVDWRAELKKKLSQHAEKKGKEADLPERQQILEPQSRKLKAVEDAVQKEGSEGLRPSIFDYRLKESEPGQQRRGIITLSKEQPLSEGRLKIPLANTRTQGRPARYDDGSRQFRFKMESQSPAVRAEEQDEQEETPESAPKITREILVSRYLAGIIDLCLPLALGIIFSLAASLILLFDFFRVGSFVWTAFFGCCFFYLNSFYFLFATGQTPGMYFTGLRLVTETGDTNVPAASIVLRVLCFIPVVLTLVGLLWCLFDSQYRGLHDLASRTRIEPAEATER